MCGRYTQGKAIPEVVAWYARLGAALIAGDQVLLPGFNIAPRARAAVVFRDGEKVLVGPMRWGLVPRWTKELDPKKPQPFNARSEGADTSGMFRDAFCSGRCLVPATGFYEWKGDKPPKQPYFIHPADQEAFSFAGLWSRWRQPDGEDLLTFTILTTEANETVKPLHDRMPCILHPDEEAEWLDGGTAPDRLKALLLPYPAGQTAAYPVSTAVNKPGMDGPELMQPIAPPNESPGSLLC